MSLPRTDAPGGGDDRRPRGGISSLLPARELPEPGTSRPPDYVHSCQVPPGPRGQLYQYSGNLVGRYLQ